MKIKDLKNWLDKLPNNYDETNIVFRTIRENDVDSWKAFDINISACGIDEGNNEMYLCDEKSAKMIEKQIC